MLANSFQSFRIDSMTNIKSPGSSMEIPVNPRFNSYDLSFCKNALGATLKDSKSLTVYLPPVGILTGRSLLTATETASRLLGAGIRHTGIGTMERGNMIYQVRRDDPLNNFMPFVGSPTNLAPHLTGYMRVDRETEDNTPLFTVGAINFETREFTAVKF